MELSGYLRALRRRWWIVASVIVIGAVLGVLKTVVATDVYSASVTFYVSSPKINPDNAYGFDQFAQDRANSYAELLSSGKLARRVLDTTHVDLSQGELTSAISGTAELNTVLVQATVLDTDIGRLRKIANGVAQQFPLMISELENQGGADEVSLNVVSGPTVSPTPVSPRPMLNLALGVGIGLIIGLLLAALREALDTTIRSPAELEEVAGVPVLGAIVFDASTDRVQALVGLDAQGRRAEDFRQLRANLDFVHTVQSVQVIAVTSAVAGEGKSTTALNVALMAAERGARVLLVDADLRRPRIAPYLGLESSVGLTTVLAGRVTFDQAVRTWGDLKVLPSGTLPPNPTELLDSDAMADLISEWRDRFDFIVMDTPPVLVVADAVVCSSIVDGTLVIYRYGRTRRAQLVSAMHALRSVQARVVGTVLNARPRRGADGADYGLYAEYEESSGQLVERIRSATQGPEVLRALRDGLLNPPRPERRAGANDPEGGWRPDADAEPPARSSGTATGSRQTTSRGAPRSPGSERRRG